MTAQAQDIDYKNRVAVGDTFNHWTVVSGPLQDKNRIKYWMCRCVCGVEKKIKQYSLLNNLSHSCGCKREVSEKTKAILAAIRAAQGSPFPKGSKMSEDTKKRMSEAHIKRHALKKAQQGAA